MTGDVLSIAETAKTLGISTRHARRLADSGAVTRIARGVVDRASVERYRRSQRQGRTRAWAEHTAWGAVATLEGQDADWLGATQAARLRSTLRAIDDVDGLLTRTRDRARTHRFHAHRAALPHLREQITATDLRLLAITDWGDDGVDGYLPEADLAPLVRALGLRADGGGPILLRTTNFDPGRVRALVVTTTTTALDAATSTDPRLRSVGRRMLADLLDAYR